MDTFISSKNNAPELPLPAPELARLNVFVGHWHAEGDSYGEQQAEDNAPSKAIKWVSDESYEWMSGNYFLLHRWDATVGGRNLKGLEIIGYDVARDEFFSRMFDNSGNVIKYKATVHDHAWRFSEPFTRTNIVFSDNGNSVNFKWEWRQEGGDWLPLSNRTAVRVPQK